MSLISIHIREFNRRFAARITRAVGTMWTAYLFTMIAFISFPAAISSHNPVIIISWLSQSFLQLTLLSVIMVGQDQQAGKMEALIKDTHEIVAWQLHEITEIAQRLHAHVIPPPEIDETLDDD